MEILEQLSDWCTRSATWGTGFYLVKHVLHGHRNHENGLMDATQLTLTREQVRKVDQLAINDYGLAGVVLMENAGRGCAELLQQLAESGNDRRVCICCGRGNNGGDGYVIARHLENQGWQVQVFIFADSAEEIHGDAAANLHVLEKSETPLVYNPAFDAVSECCAQADWIVDALLGTGMTGDVRSPEAEVIDCINRAGKPILSVDVPSGLDCNTGSPLGTAVRATATATFVAHKPGFAMSDARQYTGEVRTIDIGVPKRLLMALVASADSRP